jgi:DNA polymerase-1
LSYGIAYGTTGRNISETLNVMLASQGYKITPQDGDDLIAKWYSLFPTTAGYLNANARKAVLDGYVTDAWGRRRNWDRSMFIDKWKRFAAEREGKNAGIQGSSATMTKRAIQLFWERADFSKAKMIICVHDEIVVESDQEYTETACALLKEAMEQAIKEVLPNVAHEVGKYEGTSVDPKISVRYDK